MVFSRLFLKNYEEWDFSFMIHTMVSLLLTLQCGGGLNQSEAGLEMINHQQLEEGKNDSSASSMMEENDSNGEASNDDSSGLEKVFYSPREKNPINNRSIQLEISCDSADTREANELYQQGLLSPPGAQDSDEFSTGTVLKITADHNFLLFRFEKAFLKMFRFKSVSFGYEWRSPTSWYQKTEHTLNRQICSTLWYNSSPKVSPAV